MEVERTNGREVTIEYLARDARGRTNAHWLVCGFRASAFRGDRLTVSKMVTDRRGVFNATQLQMLNIWQRLMAQAPPPSPSLAPPTAGPPVRSPLYLLQQGVNALVPCAVYALLAVGFSLVYGLLGRINFAFGEIAAIAGISFFLGLTLAAANGTVPGIAIGCAIILVAVVIAAGCSLASERVVFRPLLHADSQAALIAAFGLALVMREGLRLAYGLRDFWLTPVVSRTWVLARDSETAVTVSALQLVLMTAAVAVGAAIALLLRRSRFGRHYRACCQNALMATLVGINVARTAALTFALAGAAVGIAGVFITVYYGNASTTLGVLLGFKALVAAIVGGFGSLPGAIVGGISVGFVEQLWSAYLGAGTRDLGVFALLVLAFILRPCGLFGHRDDRDQRW